TSGFCTSKVTIRCKLTSLNDKQVQNLEKAGIKVVTDGDTTITGRIKPTALEFNGKTLTGANLAREMRADRQLGTALNRGYNPKMGGFVDKVWRMVSDRLKMSKLPLFDSSVANDAARSVNPEECTENGTSSKGSSLYVESDDEFDDGKKK